MVPLFFESHLNIVADLLAVDLTTVKTLHRFIAITTWAITLARIFVQLYADPGFSLAKPSDLNLSIVSLLRLASFGTDFSKGVCALSILVLPLLAIKRRSYKIYLRMHQSIALLAAVCLQLAFFSASLLNKICVCVCFGIFLFTSILSLAFFFHRNSVLKGLPSLQLRSYKNTVILSKLILRKSFGVEIGQYIIVCVPGAKPLSFLQWHPFTVAEIERTENETHLTLLIEPRSGLTSTLLQRAIQYEKQQVERQQESQAGRQTKTKRRAERQAEKYAEQYATQPLSYAALILGPFGSAINCSDYRSVVMVASGSGIISHLPYLLQLSAADAGYVRRVKVLLQLNTSGKLFSKYSELALILFPDRGRGWEYFLNRILLQATGNKNLVRGPVEPVLVVR